MLRPRWLRRAGDRRTRAGTAPPALPTAPDDADAPGGTGRMLSPALRSILPLVEGLGDNCELGFYLESRGLKRGHLLRFALLSIDELVRFVSSEERCAFAFEDLVPYSKTMVRDRATGIAFHSRMRSTRTDDGWCFETDEAERRAIYPDEKDKHDFLLDRFETALRSDTPHIYVVKANERLMDERIASLDAVLRERRAASSFMLLAVEADDRIDAVPKIDVLNELTDTVCRARVASLAPYHRASEIDTTSWDRVFKAVAGTGKVREWLDPPVEPRLS